MRLDTIRPRDAIHALLAAALVCILSFATAAGAAEKFEFTIDSGEARRTLNEFGRQSGLQLLFDFTALRGVSTRAVKGRMEAGAALEQMLSGTGLTYKFTNPETISIVPLAPKEVASKVSSQATGESTASSFRLAQTEDEYLSQSAGPAKNQRAVKKDATDSTTGPEKGVMEILVHGSRVLNMDIKRSADDPQPYVIFDRETIEHSGALDLDDFFRSRLSMNSSGGTQGQGGGSAGDISTVNLRGLGINQTLILIDGRRAAKSSIGYSTGQPDINGIPLSAIERIEVLPTTASAIYGGAATGGVVNIVLRRDHSGADVKVAYDNSFDTDSARRRIDTAAGFNFLQGRTNVLLQGSFTDSNHLLLNDRDFLQRGRATLLANNPAIIPAGNSPPPSTTANIRSTNGANLVLKNGTALNSPITHAPVGYAGAASDGGAALVANAGRYNLAVADTSAIFGFGNGGMTNFTPRTRRHMFGGSVRHEFSPRLRAFLEASRAENLSLRMYSAAFLGIVAVSSPTNPFLQPIRVHATTDQLNGEAESISTYDRLSSGLIFDLPRDWMGGIDYTFTDGTIEYRGTPYTSAAFTTAVSNGTINILRDINAYPIDLSGYVSGLTEIGEPLESTVRNSALRFGGPLARLKAGALQLSMLLEHQQIRYSSATQFLTGGTFAAVFPERTQEVGSAYLEMLVPLLSSANHIPWVETLELQIAGRWDNYRSVSGNFATYSPPSPPPNIVRIGNEVRDFNPLVALRFQPDSSFTIRASYGTGFLPPEVNQLGLSNTLSSSQLFVDPRRGNSFPAQNYTLVSGGNPNLQPEYSTSWSTGLILTPRWIEDLRLSLDYTRIRKRDNITTLTLQQIVDNESYFPGRVLRGANLPGDQPGWAGPVTEIDSTTINSATASIQAYDLNVDYLLSTSRAGSFSFFAMATWQTEFKSRVHPLAPILEYAGVLGGGTIPLKFRTNGGMVWTLNQWTLGWAAQYMGPYYVANPAVATSVNTFRSQGNGGKVRSQMYHDVFGKYRFGQNFAPDSRIAGGLLNGLEVQAGVRNIFNAKPPYDATNPYSYYSWLGNPRLASYYFELKRNF